MTSATITIFPSNKGISIHSVRSMTLAEIETVIRMVPPAPSKDRLPLLKFATFGNVRTPKGSLRHDVNVLTVTGIEGDYDGEKQTMEEAADRCKEAGITVLLYTSASHEPDKPRYRALCPLAAPITGTEDELRERRAHWVGVLNAILGGVLKGESFALSQTFYFGAIAGRPAPSIVRLEGASIDQMHNPPEPVMPVSARNKADRAQTGDDASSDWPSPDDYDDRSAHLLACVRKALLVKKLSPPTVRKLFADHPHVLDQSDPVRALNRCIERVLEGQPPAGDVLEGIDDSRVIALVRPHVDSGAILVASNLVPDPTAARIAFRALRPSLFVQGGQVVEIVQTRDGPQIGVVDEKALVDRVSKGRAVLQVHVRGERLSADRSRFPVAQAALLLKSTAVREELREICLVVQRPIAVEHDGQLTVLHPGFNDGPGIYVVSGQEIPDVPMDVATRDLLSLLSGYQFAGDADRSRAVAALVLPALVLGQMLKGHRPLVLIEANESQAGKTLLANLIAALYGERLQAITQRAHGGVGSVDESISDALLRANPFVLLDNFRGHLDSPHLEAIITAGSTLIGCRVPHRGLVWVSVARYVFALTSNGLELTADQANRCLVVRLVRRPDGFTFPAYKEGSLLAHVAANQSHYAGCVMAVVRRWFDAGKPRNPVLHTFEEMGALDWITQTVFGLSPLLDEHREIITRLGSPDGGLVRAIALEVERQQRLCRWVLTSTLVDVAKTAGLKPNGGWPEDDVEANKLMGRVLAKAFARTEVLDFGHLRLRRAIGQYDHKPSKHYVIWRAADGPPPPFVSDEDPM